MIYDNLKKKEQIQDIPQIKEDILKYESFFIVEEGDVIVDIGAHVGEFSKAHTNKASKIYAIEPDELFYNQLGIFSEKFRTYKIAIGSFDGVSLMKSDGNANKIGDKKGNKVQVTTFKSFLEKENINKIDFLKIDCEGGEYDIFTKDNLDWIKNNVRKIAGEFHIHNDDHREEIVRVLNTFSKNKFSYILTSLDGVILTKAQVIGNLNYYTEILFYVRLDQRIFPKNQRENINFTRGAFVELIDYPEGKYNIKFINKETEQIIHETDLKVEEDINVYSRCLYSFFINWKIIISGEDFYKEVDLDLKNKRVIIDIDSSALGDTLAWIPYAEEFRLKHGCEVYLSTFMNNLFVETYPEIKFIPKGTVLQNIEAQYNIGWFYNEYSEIDFYKNPLDFRSQPMQKTASDILGLDFKEIKPKLILPKVEKTKTVGLGIHSTLQVKYWNNPTGWQDTVDYITSMGYKALSLSKEGKEYGGNLVPDNAEILEPGTLENLISEICKCEVYVGVGCGLTWLAWACNIPVILISGFSEPYTEMSDCVRISTPKNGQITSGCFNKYRIDSHSGWNWYEPRQFIGTSRHFECSKSIKSEIVINKLKPFLT